MPWEIPRVLVIGAGAIGGITAAFIKQAGYGVKLICKYGELANAIMENGIHVFGVPGEYWVKMPAFVEIKEGTAG